MNDATSSRGVRLGRRGASLRRSPTMAAAAARTDHPDPVDLSVGESSAQPPRVAIDAACAAARDVRTRYGPVGGLPELREAIARDVSRWDGQPWTADHVVVTAGGKPALYDALACLVDAGDRVVVFAPDWPTFRHLVSWVGGTADIVEGASDGLPSVGAIEDAVDAGVRAVIVNHPSNPTGAVWDRARARALATACARHDAWVVVDQVYGRLGLDGPVAPLLALAPELAERTVSIESFSKRFAMTGYRLGAAVAPRALIDAMIALSSNTTTHASMLSQHAGVAALSHGADWERDHVASLRAKRQRIVDGLRDVPGLRFSAPAAGFFLWIDVREALDRLGVADDAGCVAHLRDALGLRLVPGSAFGAPGFVRLSFAVSDAELDKAAARLADALR